MSFDSFNWSMNMWPLLSWHSKGPFNLLGLVFLKRIIPYTTCFFVKFQCLIMSISLKIQYFII